MYRYDAPLCFANVEDFKQRALQAIDDEKTPVEWFVLNTEAIAEIDITAADMLLELHQELKNRKILFGLMRVKQDLYGQLRRSSLLRTLGEENIFPTINTATKAFQERHSGDRASSSEGD